MNGCKSNKASVLTIPAIVFKIQVGASLSLTRVYRINMIIRMPNPYSTFEHTWQKRYKAWEFPSVSRFQSKEATKSMYGNWAFVSLGLSISISPFCYGQNSRRDQTNFASYYQVPFTVNRTPFYASGINKRNTDGFDVPGTEETSITHDTIEYNVQLEIGSNKDGVTLIVDTGSSDLWVISNELSSSTSYGTYDSSTSSTYTNLGIPFSIEYIDGTSTKGSYVQDDVTLPSGPTIHQLRFADASETTSTQGILGIGLLDSEVPVMDSRNTTKAYANLPWAMKDQGIIGKAAYSLYLNSESASDGVILFGGIDKFKFDGDLLQLPGQYNSRLGIILDSVTSGSEPGETSPISTVQLGEATILDSGYTYSRFPKAVTDAIGKRFAGSTYNANNAFPWSISCVQPRDSFDLNFGNGAKSINVPYSTLIVEAGDTTCLLSLSYSSDGDDFNNLPTLGDEILRYLYVVYDLEENAISIAQAKYTSNSYIVAIE